MSSSPTLRQAAIDKLGGKCGVCGWAEDPRVLAITRKDGNDLEAHKGKSRDKHYLDVLTNADGGAWVVLCANCRFCEMYRRQDLARASKTAIIAEATKDLSTSAERETFVWQTSWSIREAMETPPGCLDEERARGRRVVIIPSDERVYEWPSGTCVGERWEGELPREATGVVAR